MKLPKLHGDANVRVSFSTEDGHYYIDAYYDNDQDLESEDSVDIIIAYTRDSDGWVECDPPLDEFDKIQRLVEDKYHDLFSKRDEFEELDELPYEDYTDDLKGF